MIDPASGAILNEGLAAITGQMVGHSLATEYDARMDKTYSDNSGITVGFGNYSGDKPAITGDASSSIVDSTEDDAASAWLDWMHDNPDAVSSQTGGAVIGSNVDTFNYSLKENADQSVEAVAPVAVPKDQAVVAIAQALGISMKLSGMSSTLLGKFVNALSIAGVLYNDNRDHVMAWKDSLDNIFFPKAALDAVEDVIEDEGIGGGEFPETVDGVDSRLSSIVFNSSLRFDSTSDPTFFYEYTMPAGVSGMVVYLGHSNQYYVVASSLNPFSVSYRVSSGYGPRTGTTNAQQATINGRTFYYIDSSPGYYFDATRGILTNVALSTRAGSTYPDASSVGYVILFGTPTEYFPEGTSESIPPAYTPSDLVSGGVARGRELVTPVCKVNLPNTPDDTTESTLDPDSATDPNRVKELPPTPLPLPIPDTIPSNPDIGLVNPSRVDEEVAKKVDELVEDLANTVDPQPPQSTGLAPLPYMPGTPVIDPETGQPTGETVYPSIVPSSGSGLIHVYNPTPAEFMAFGQWLWVTYADATIDKIWNNPFDGIIGAFELYSTPSVDGRDNIRSGFLVCPTSANLVRQRYTEINCGTVIVPEFYGNYLDYSPYSQCYIYLPFIGINEVSIDDIVGHAVNIRYRVDAYNGSCIAMIYVAKDGYENLCYQFGGNCAVEVPLAGGSQAAIKAGMMQAEAYGRAAVQSAQIQKTASIGTGIVNGASAGAGAGAMNPVAGIVGGLLGALAGGTSGYIQGSADYGAAKLNAGAMQEAARVANKSSVQHSGSFGSSHGAMGNKVPFLIIRTPIQVKVVNYNDDYGFPAHKRVIIGGCTGYLRVREVNVISAFATNEEKIAIEEALKMGVYVT